MDPINRPENGSSLSQYYDNLRSSMERDVMPAEPTEMKVGGGMMPDHMHPGAVAFRNLASKEADRLANDCHKHIIVHMYCKILPLDKDYVHGHHGQMVNDVDNMLASKGMTATQYLTSCYEATKAPLLEFVLRAGNIIGHQFLEEANETLKDAQEKGIDAPKPQAPSVEDKEIQTQLVDVKNDPEYDNFVDKLEQKTIDKVVADVSKIISGKKKEQAMTFDTTPIADAEAQVESTTSIGVNYIQSRLLKEGIELPADLQDEVIGMAIREATLNELDACFNQPCSIFREFASRVRLGKGYVISESAVQSFMEDMSAKAKEVVDKTAEQIKDEGKKDQTTVEKEMAETKQQVDQALKAQAEKAMKSVFGQGEKK